MIRNEFELIHCLARKLPPLSPQIEIGIGDDAAVIKPVAGKLLFTVDCLTENIHFDFKYSEPEEVGHKALAVNLSDIAAMGGIPVAAIVSLGVPKDTKQEMLEKIYQGLGDLALKHAVDVVGGNISASNTGLFLSVSVLGRAEHPVLNRSGAKAGDIIFISGSLGESAAGLALLQKWGKKAKKDFPQLTQKHLKPEPQLKLGEFLSQREGINSLIDVSDGLSSELWHLASSSDVRMRIWEDCLALSPDINRAAESLQLSAKNWILSGGEDYLLLGTVDASCWNNLKSKAAERLWELTKIGEVTGGPMGVELVSTIGISSNLSPSGWNHLSSSRKGLT